MARVLYLAKGGNVAGAQRQLLYLVSDLTGPYEPVVVCTTGGETVTQLRSAGIETEVLPLRPWRKLPNLAHRYFDAERLVALARRYEPVARPDVCSVNR